MKTKRPSVEASRRRKKIDRGNAAAVVSTILVPVDFSTQSSKALHYACTLAKAFGARLQLLHMNEAVVDAPALASAFPVAEAEQLRRLDDFSAGLSLPSRGLRCHIRAGRAFDEICHAARELSADLIVCGTHGYRGMARLLLGAPRKGSCNMPPLRCLSCESTSGSSSHRGVARRSATADLCG